MNNEVINRNTKFNFTLDKLKSKSFLIYLILIISSIACAYFFAHNESFYDEPIGKIISVGNTTYAEEQEDGKSEQMIKQDIECILKNGSDKDQIVNVKNTASFSNVDDLNLKENDEVFLEINKDESGNIESAKITGFKRDKYVAYIAIIFVLLILIVGKKVGAKSLLSLVINVIVTMTIIFFFSKGINLNLLFFIGGILFVILSLYIVSGKNEKSFSAMISTFASLLITLIIAFIVIKITNWSGVHFEDMEFLTHPPENIFFIEIIIGTLGGILDISISITSAVNELLDKNQNSDLKAIINSGRKIGQDIMGTMSNTLVFAYLSGSIPLIVLVLRNGYPILYILKFNLSLEVIRAIVSSIGIVLSIPITLFTSIIMMKNKHAKEIKE